MCPHPMGLGLILALEGSNLHKFGPTPASYGMWVHPMGFVGIMEEAKLGVFVRFVRVGRGHLHGPRVLI